MDIDDIINRIFTKLDTYEERLGTTCETMTRIDQRLTDFINSVNKKDDETKNNIEKRYKNITVIFGSITTISVLIGIGKVLGVI